MVLVLSFFDDNEELVAIDLKTLNHKQLAELIKKAEQRKVEVAKEGIVKVREKIHALLKAEGLMLDEMLGKERDGAAESRLRQSTATLSINRRLGAAVESVRAGSTRHSRVAREQDLLIK
jgi:DNA-binding protein H-NS